MIKIVTRINLALIVLLTLLVTSGCATTNVREHPTLETQLLDVDSVLIVTPAVTIEQINFSSDNERLYHLESDIEKELIKLANTELSARGFEIVDFDLEKAIAEDEELAYAVTQAEDGFSEAKKTLYGASLSEEEKRKFKVSVGTAVNIVSQKSGADAVLLMHYIGQTKSGGSMAKDIAVGVLVGLLTGSVPVANSESSYVEIAFIDGVTGDVLWSNMLSAASLNLNAATMAMEAFPQDVDVPVNIAQSEENSEVIEANAVTLSKDAEIK